MNNDRRDDKQLDETVWVALSEPALTVDLEATQQTLQTQQTQKLPERITVDQTQIDPEMLDQTQLIQAESQVAAGPVLWAPYQAVPGQSTEALQELGPGEYLHFGPGVPVPSVSTTGQAGAIWRGEAPAAEPPPRRRWLLNGWLLPILVLIVVLAILAWMRFGHPIAVTGAEAHVQSTTLGCGATATITGTLQTNGNAGTVSYEWKRSDGTESAVLQQRFAKGTRQVNVALLWTFSGQGNIQATATLDVLSPNAVSASTNFTYTCE
jgi:hypothetical protein